MVSPKGDAPPPRAGTGLGYGLGDVRQRLELAYGDAAKLTIHEENERFHVDLDVPG